MNTRFLACMLAGLLFPAFAHAQLGPTPRTPDQVLQGTASARDARSYRTVDFTVPPGTTRLTLAFNYTGRERRAGINYGLIGPDGWNGQDGFRGWTYSDKKLITIARTDATPSFSPGTLKPGRWQLLLGITNVRAGDTIHYTAKLWFDRDDPRELQRMPLATVIKPVAGWYRGDLHMHDGHSDAGCFTQSNKVVPCPVFFSAQSAAARGLDFIAVTDHNTVSQANTLRELQPFFDTLLLIPGREITTYEGHINLWGTVAPLDFRVTGEKGRSMAAMLADANRLGGVLSINHPREASGEECIGCGWTPSGQLDYAQLQAVEIVNGSDWKSDHSGLPFWEARLNAGERLTGVGGSDNHNGPNRDPVKGPPIGIPTTVVQARELSIAGILDGLRAGHVFVDVTGTRTAQLQVKATQGTASAAMGEMLDAPAQTRLQAQAQVSGVAGDARLVWVLDGVRSTPRSLDTESIWTSDGKRHWLRADVVNARGEPLLIGNPVYINWRK